MTITVNGVESKEVSMLLGHEGEAFFLRQAFEDEAATSIENVSSSMRHAVVDSTKVFRGAKDSEPQKQGPKSGHDAAEYKNGSHMLDELDIDDDIKKGTNSSPKSAHHAMGLEAADYNGSLNPKK